MAPETAHDRLWQHELMRRELERKSRSHTLFPLMVSAQSDTADRKRLEMQSIPWALPGKKDRDDG